MPLLIVPADAIFPYALGTRLAFPVSVLFNSLFDPPITTLPFTVNLSELKSPYINGVVVVELSIYSLLDPVS